MPYNRFSLPEFPVCEDTWDVLSREERPVLVYGMGNGADKLLNRFEKYGIAVADFFASDGFVRGHSFHGKRVKSYSEVSAEYPDFVIAVSFASSRPEVLELITARDAERDTFIPDMPVVGEDEYFDRDFYNSNYRQIVRAYDSLADEDSKNCFAAVVNYKLTGKLSYLEGAWSTKDELYSLLPCEKIKRVVDAVRAKMFPRSNHYADDDDAWSKIPTKIEMNEILSTDVVVNESTKNPDKWEGEK